VKNDVRVLMVVKMTLYELKDEEIRDYLCQTATTIEKSLHFVRILADGFVHLPSDCDARTQLIDSGLTIQATLADELDAIRRVLENSAVGAAGGDGAELN
jgi:hypothetical protein